MRITRAGVEDGAVIGCAYYPEHWPSERWPLDAEIMREAGVQVVRVGEFAWDKMEPQPNVYDFEWLDEAVGILEKAGLKVIMCTPTATPPPWLLHQHPEILRVLENGVRVGTASRRLTSANVPVYLEYSRKIVERIAYQYANHSAVVGWQIDNEFGCGETTRSYCDYNRAAFQQWLQLKYRTLDSLNQAWGTQFWGSTYTDWAFIPVPGITTEPQNPSMRLDYRRFSSDSWVKFQQMQVEILRPLIGDRFITHNFMIRHWSLDYWKLAQDLDFVSYDNYPHGVSGPAEVAMNFDLMRSFKARSFWVMEQQPGPVNWHPYNPPVPDGQVRLWSHQAIAHGAEGVVYFRYRASRFGQEQYHRGLLKWDGNKDRAFYESQQVAAEVETLPKFQRRQAKVAIVFDYDDLWAIELEPHTQNFRYWDLVYDIYRAYWDTNIMVDFVRRNFDPEGYETLVVPAAILTHEGEVEKWQRWVGQGGRLIVTFRSGVREASNISEARPLPAGLVDLVGARVDNYLTVPPDAYAEWRDHRMGSHIRSVQSQQVTLAYHTWAEMLIPEKAVSVYEYADGYLTGKTAITRHQVGQGEVFYIGCWVPFAKLARLQGWIPQMDSALDKTILHGEDGSVWQVTMNHHAVPVEGMPDFAVSYERLDA